MPSVKLSANTVAGIVIGSTPAGTKPEEWVALARKESSFYADAVNGNAIGLWQIMVTKHMDKIGAVSIEDAKSDMKSPLRNWYVARIIYGESGWKAWEAFGFGRPIPTKADRDAVANPDFTLSKSGGFAGDPGEARALSVKDINPLDTLGDAVKILQGAADWLSDRDNWVRVIQVTGGVLLGLVALGIVLKPLGEEIGKVSPL